MNCPRVMSLDTMITGLKKGHTLNVDRSDAPELQELLQLEKEGKVVSELVILDEQSSVLKFKWKELVE